MKYNNSFYTWILHSFKYLSIHLMARVCGCISMMLISSGRKNLYFFKFFNSWDLCWLYKGHYHNIWFASWGSWPHSQAELSITLIFNKDSFKLWWLLRSLHTVKMCSLWSFLSANQGLNEWSKYIWKYLCPLSNPCSLRVEVKSSLESFLKKNLKSV